MPPEETEDGNRATDPRSLDSALEVLSQYQRREIIRYLREDADQTQSLDDLIDHLIDVEVQTGGEVPGEDHMLAVVVHVHGPRLDEIGLVSYDIATGEVTYHTNEKIERVLDQIDQIASEW